MMSVPRIVAVCVVALLAEGVDRNGIVPSECSCDLVALLAEGVDRNATSAPWRTKPAKSPSSRRAWIEMSLAMPWRAQPPVALLAEGVDRNRVFPAKQSTK